MFNSCLKMVPYSWEEDGIGDKAGEIAKIFRKFP
jgi:hypothetical protein